jgi:hypothetical protein
MKGSVVWAIHPIDTKWHAVQHVEDGGSVITYCRGRWPNHETAAIDIAPPHEDRCGGCDVLVYAEQLAEAT